MKDLFAIIIALGISAFLVVAAAATHRASTLAASMLFSLRRRVLAHTKNVEQNALRSSLLYSVEDRRPESIKCGLEEDRLRAGSLFTQFRSLAMKRGVSPGNRVRMRAAAWSLLDESDYVARRSGSLKADRK